MMSRGSPAQERIYEMEAKMDNMLKTVDKFFKVELMKMPPSLQRTLIGELIDSEAGFINYELCYVIDLLIMNSGVMLFGPFALCQNNLWSKKRNFLINSWINFTSSRRSHFQRRFHRYQGQALSKVIGSQGLISWMSYRCFL